MSKKQLSGTGVALVTPFRKGTVDFEALGRIIEHCIEGGVDFLVSLGTTGESVTLDSEECRAVFDFTIQQNAGRLPLIAGMFGGNNTERLKKRIQDFNFDGFDVIMSSNPAYVKPSQEGIYRHYMELAEVAPLPMMIYNVPGRTSSNMSPQTCIRLAKNSDRFIAIKEASGNLAQGIKLLKDKPDDFLVFSGDDPTAHALIAAGANGVISVIANAFPMQFSGMVRALQNSDLREARRLNEMLYDIHHWLYVDGNPVGVKSCLEILGFCEKTVRLPLYEMSAANYQALKVEVSKVMAASHVKMH